MHALLLIAALLTLVGCATTTATSAGSKGVCAIWQPITWADADTDETLRQVKANNAARESFCQK